MAKRNNGQPKQIKHDRNYWFEFVEELAKARGGWYKGILSDALAKHQSIPYRGPLPSMSTLQRFSAQYEWRDRITKNPYFNIAQQALTEIERRAHDSAGINLAQVVARQKAIADEWQATAEDLRDRAISIISQFGFEEFTPKDAIALMELGFKISHGASNLQRSLVGLELATDKVVQENQTITNIVVQGAAAAKQDALQDIAAHDTTAEGLD